MIKDYNLSWLKNWKSFECHHVIHISTLRSGNILNRLVDLIFFIPMHLKASEHHIHACEASLLLLQFMQYIWNRVLWRHQIWYLVYAQRLMATVMYPQLKGSANSKNGQRDHTKTSWTKLLFTTTRFYFVPVTDVGRSDVKIATTYQ